MEFWRNCLLHTARGSTHHTVFHATSRSTRCPAAADSCPSHPLCAVADFSHVAAILHASGAISTEQAMQPHREHHQTQSRQPQDQSTKGSIEQRAAAEGTMVAGVQQPSVSAAPSYRAPAALSVAFAPVTPLPSSTMVAGGSSPSDTALSVVHCGVIGSGRSASRLISQLAVTRGCRVVSVLSKNDSRTAALRRQFPTVGTVQTDLSTFLSHPDVHAVFIASAVGSVKYGSHHALALACAEHRKPTVVDRPFARSAGEAREMQLAFERAQIPLLAHQPLRALPAISTLQQSIVALQRVTSISYSFSAPLSSLGTSSPSLSSPLLPCLPSALSSSGGPTLPLVCDLFDVLECVLGAVSDVSGAAVHQPASTAVSLPVPVLTSGSAPPAASAGMSSEAAMCESVLSCSFRCGGALGAAVWDVASASHDDRLVLRGTGGDLTLPLYQPTMPILQTAAGIQQVASPHKANGASTLDTLGSEAMQRLVDELRRSAAVHNKAVEGAGSDTASTSAVAAAHNSGGSSGSGGGTGGGDGAAVDVCLVTSAMAVRSLACADAALRSFYRLRTDAYWDRPHTWQSHVVTVPALPK